MGSGACLKQDVGLAAAALAARAAQLDAVGLAGAALAARGGGAAVLAGAASAAPGGEVEVAGALQFAQAMPLFLLQQ